MWLFDMVWLFVSSQEAIARLLPWLIGTRTGCCCCLAGGATLDGVSMKMAYIVFAYQVLVYISMSILDKTYHHNMLGHSLVGPTLYLAFQLSPANPLRYHVPH